MFKLLLRWMKAQKILPRISETERLALDAGTIWIDGEFFRGSPDFRHMLSFPYGRLPPEEQAFLDGPTDELCRMLDREAISRSRRVPDEVIDFIKRQGFMGLLIPKAYGGKAFSTLGISMIMSKIQAYSAPVAMFVVIPNSLGAAELIKHYGTEAQKNDYLPKLARGEYVPCFGLTEPTAGSDAAAIKAEALVFRGEDGRPQLKLNFRKRYITLAPVANLVTIACKLVDPENLLGKGAAPGITCVLIHKGTPGFHSGDHHEPIGDAFYNGPLVGENVVVPADNIIGGADGAGQGWRMLMEQLAGGRAVSLPAGAVGMAKLATAATGPYSIVRQQFGIPIGRMEGVEEKIGKIAGLSYMLEAARVFGCSALDAGEKPPVVSAVLKAYTTALSQELVIDGMDVFSGAGVMQGPSNILGRCYTSSPVGITVEGANILTRTLMIFGQGATRCHPYALKVVDAVEADDVPAFRANLLGWIGHFLANIGRSMLHYATRGFSVSAPAGNPTARYYRRFGWAATRFAVMTDLAMFFIGGKLKIRGKLTGRFSDVLAWLILGFSALRRWEADGRKAEDLPLVHYACQYAQTRIQLAFEEIYANFTAPVVGIWYRSIGLWLLRANRLGGPPSDRISRQCAKTIQTPSAQYERLTAGVFFPPEETPGMGRLLQAFRIIDRVQPAVERVVKAQKAGQLGAGLPALVADEAVQKGIIAKEEAAQLHEALEARLLAIEVDAFTPERYFVEYHSDRASMEPVARLVANG